MAFNRECRTPPDCRAGPPRRRFHAGTEGGPRSVFLKESLLACPKWRADPGLGARVTNSIRAVCVNIQWRRGTRHDVGGRRVDLQGPGEGSSVTRNASRSSSRMKLKRHALADPTMSLGHWRHPCSWRRLWYLWRSGGKSNRRFSSR